MKALTLNFNDFEGVLVELDPLEPDRNHIKYIIITQVINKIAGLNAGGLAREFELCKEVCSADRSR